MRAYEILFEKATTEQFKHGKYMLVHTLEPNANGEYIGMVYGPEKKAIQKLQNGDLPALKKEFVTMANSHEREELKKNVDRREKISAKDIRKSALDFNTAFTMTVLENEVPTAIRLSEEGGKLYLDVMTRKYYEADGVENDKAFRPLRDRAWNKRSRTKIYMAYASPIKLEQMGFDFHGVYGLSEETSPEPDKYTRFSLDLVGYSDKLKSYQFPAVTIAFWYKGDQKPEDEVMDESTDPAIIAIYYDQDGDWVNITKSGTGYYGYTSKFDFERPDLKSLQDTLRKWGYTRHDYGKNLLKVK